MKKKSTVKAKQSSKSEAESGIKTEWDLGLLYASDSDPQIERDMQETERAYAAFAKKYKNRTDYFSLPKADKGTAVKHSKATESEIAAYLKTLVLALNEYEKLIEYVGSAKPLAYFYLSQSVRSEDASLQARINLLSERYTAAANQILFFELNLGKIDSTLQKHILEQGKGAEDKTSAAVPARLAHFSYFLRNIFNTSKHNLSEAEEKILNMKSLPGYSLWVQGVERVLAKLTVPYEGKQIPLAQATNMIPDLPTVERRAMHRVVTSAIQPAADFSESEINAIVLNKKNNDELRKFERPFSATVLGYQNDEKSVLAMVDAVTKRYPVSHRFYAIKSKMLDLRRLEYADRAATIQLKTPVRVDSRLQNASSMSITGKISFTEAVATLKKVFGDLDPLYEQILDRFLADGQIDVFPRKGKQDGAFCAGNQNLPTFVLLNQVNSFDSLTTFAHEMGHAIHTELSKRQPTLYQGYSTAVAETASTLFEQFVFDYVVEQLPEEERVIALHDRLQDQVQTVFRQIACFNFELELHERIRKEGNLPKEEIARLMNSHMKAYLGPLFDLTEDDGYFFIRWSHIRRFFYVYSYAYGALISRVLYANYRKDPGYMKKIEQFLSAGGSKSPEQIFKDIGIDATKPQFFLDGIASIEADIARLESIVRSRKM